MLPCELPHLNGCDKAAVLQGHVQAHGCQVITQPAGRVLHPQGCIQGRQDAGLRSAGPKELLALRPHPCTQVELSTTRSLLLWALANKSDNTAALCDMQGGQS